MKNRMMVKRKLVLVDGMSILHRAYHAYPLSLSTKSGEIVNAVYGFTAILFTILEKLQPTHVIVTWDVGAPTFRHFEYEQYKANREKPDEALLSQIERTHEVVDALNIPQFGKEGFEADDLIGTLATQAETKDGFQIVIATGDRDALQLVDDKKVVVWMPPAPGKYGKDRGSQEYDEEAVKAKYGLTPRQIIELKALMGDSSDNIPGIKGVGPKTATKLLQAWESVEKMYKVLKNQREEIVKVMGERVTKLLEEGEEKAFLSKKLATIDCWAPIKLDWKNCRLSDYDREKVLTLFEELQFKSLIKRLPKDKWEEDVEEVFK